MTLVNDYAPLVLRICLVMLFPFSGVDKILNWNSAMKQAGNIPCKPAMLVASIIVEFVTPPPASSPDGMTGSPPSSWRGSA